jgi:hypothetical protein
MTQRTLLDTMLDTSVHVGSLIVPAGSLESYLGRFASQLTVWAHDDVYKISIPGSAIGLVHAGRTMLVCSKHQLKDVELSDVSILLPDGSLAITSSGSRTFRTGHHNISSSDAYDLAAFDFSEPACEFPALSNNFFKFDCIPPDTPNTHILAFVVAGYPTADQKYDLEDENHLGMVRRILIAESDSQPADIALLKLKFIRHLDFDPDGLSGGPAFVIQIVDGTPRAYLGGMVLRAGKSHCYILKSGFLWDFLCSFQ